MAGYNGFSMSNNAVEAYNNGLVPASKIKGMPAVLVTEWCEAGEWHHTSKHYNRTNFYDAATARMTFGLDPQNGDVPSDHVDDAKTWAEVGNKAAMAALVNHKASEKVDSSVTHKDCFVQWLEWSGSRNHPSCEECKIEGATVVVKGKTATINGYLTKRLDTNGFGFIPEYTKFQKEEAKQKKIMDKASAIRRREYERECVADGRKLPKSLQLSVKFEGRAWAALSNDGKRVVNVFQMDLDKADSKHRTHSFCDYRNECKAELAKAGVVMTGQIVKVKTSFYLIAKRGYETFDAGFQDALANQ